MRMISQGLYIHEIVLLYTSANRVMDILNPNLIIYYEFGD